MHDFWKIAAKDKRQQPTRRLLIFAHVISQETIQQIISRIDIVEVVGDYVKLKKRGVNYLGLCPFHNEKTPSFTVSPNKEIYKCFGCGKSGNTISFLMEHDKLTYPEALRVLAKRYNVEIEESATDPDYKEHQQLADSLLIINQFARQFFEEQLWDTDEGKDVGLSYLQQRGFSDDTIRKFQLGYNPGHRTLLADEAQKRKYNPELLLKSGLVSSRDGQLVDNYRERVIFPIHNHIGKVIGFGARLIKKNDKAPKYINTPENEVYVKSRVLYGIYFARQTIDKQDECLLVEGYTDVISLHQAGIENVVASGGTALTQDQLRLIKKYTNNLTIVYDGDPAGVKAALRGLDLALEEGLSVHLVLIPDNEDPDSYVNKVGSEAFRELISQNKKDFILFQLELGLKEAAGDINKKSALVDQIAETIGSIDKVLFPARHEDMVKRVSRLLDISEQGLTYRVDELKRKKIEKQQAKQQTTPQQQLTAAEDQLVTDDALSLVIGFELQERAVVKVLLCFGTRQMYENSTVADFIFEQLESFQFDNQLLERIYFTYKSWFEAGLQPSEKSFLYYGDTGMGNMVISLLEFPYELSPRWEEIMAGRRTFDADKQNIADARNSVFHFKLRKLKQMLLQNQQELEKASTREEQEQLIDLHMQLKKYETDITRELGTVILK
jgi:DNA primase